MGIMLSSLKKRYRWAAMLAVLLSLGTIAVPVAAHANGSTFGVTRSSGQPGEGVGIFPTGGVSCPAGYISEIRATVMDSFGMSWTTTVAETNSYGVWSAGVVKISPYAAHGSASIMLSCASEFGENYPYAPMNSFTITEQSTEMTVDRVQFGMNSTISSVAGQGCSPGEGFSAAIYGTEANNVTGTYPRGLEPVMTFGGMSDSSGNWSHQFPVDNNSFEPNKHYFARVDCNDNGNTYSSFKFTPRWNEYVALGDSYSSGEGSFNYDLVGGGCHRSTDSYPHYLADTLSLDLPDLQACSGAVTNDLYAIQYNRPGAIAQLEPLNGYTKNVTLTIGGNDIGFGDIAGKCAKHVGNDGYACGGLLNDEVQARISALRGVDTTPGDGQMIQTPGTWMTSRPIHPIKTILSDIAVKAPNAKIYIAGYPELFSGNTNYYEDDIDAPGGHTCTVSTGLFPTVKYAYWDTTWMNGVAQDLNDVIFDAVTELNNPKIEYVDPTNFAGHRLCDASASYLNGVLLSSQNNPMPESLHPNVPGMTNGYGANFASAMNN